MATKRFVATPTPAALPGTTDDTDYSIQNQGEEQIFAASAAAAPDPTDDPPPAKIIMPPYDQTVGGTVTMSHPSGESIYLWTRPLGPDIEVGWDEV